MKKPKRASAAKAKKGRKTSASRSKAAPRRLAKRSAKPARRGASAADDLRATIRGLRGKLKEAERRVAELEAAADTDFLLEIRTGAASSASSRAPSPT